MDSNFWKMFGTLFGIGAAVSLAKYAKSKSKKSLPEVISECFITGIFSCGATVAWLIYPDVNPAAIVGVGALGAVLGMNFFSETLERFIAKWTKKDG